MITVITASLPTRSGMLAECMASIRAQSEPPAVHFVGVDHIRAGSSAMRNALLYAARTEYVAVLDDDDVALPHHLEMLRVGAKGGADIVYSDPIVEGRPGWNPFGPFDADRLRRESYIPATALIRAELVQDLGGWRDSAEVANGWEDWDLWLRCLDAGASFAHVPVLTWRYRFHDGNKTNRGEAGAR